MASSTWRSCPGKVGSIPPTSGASSRCLHTASSLLHRRSVIVGAGYIAVEIAGILSTLGSKSSLLIRQDKVVPLPVPTCASCPAVKSQPTGVFWLSLPGKGGPELAGVE